MLSALSIEDAIAIAEAAARRTRDERAMVDYLGVGRHRPARGLPDDLRLVRPSNADLAAFDSIERRRLHELVAGLSVEARQELAALVWSGGSTRLVFARALRRAQRMPPEALLGYLVGRRLEQHIPAGLERLGLKP